MRDVFSTYHPIVNFFFFTMVLCFAMFFIHPLCQGISLAAALCYSGYLTREKALRFNLLYMLPLLLFTVALNPLFNHQGATILTYFKSGNPLTLESILYGVSAAVMLITVLGWFSCVVQILTSDKFIYLFGRIVPSLSLVLSMTMRLVPHFKAQLKHISLSQRYIGKDVSNGGLLTRAKNGIRILSVMVTWALENAIETADSMKSRGYGLKGRTAFSIYRFDKRDRVALAFMVCCSVYVIWGAFRGGLSFRYYPTMKGSALSLYSASIFAVYLALCITPVVMNLYEDIKWKTLESKI